WALPLGPTKLSTATRLPPTFFTKSPRIEKLATTGRRSCARAGPASTSAARAASTYRRVSTASSFSCFEVPARKSLPHQTADATEQQRDQIESAGDKDDGGAGADADMEGDQKAGIAGNGAARRCDDDHERDVACPEAADRRRQHHDADGKQGAERIKPAHQIEHHEHQESEVR